MKFRSTAIFMAYIRQSHVRKIRAPDLGFAAEGLAMVRMKIIIASAIGVMTLVSSAAVAFPSRGPKTIEQLQAPLPADATKRTYEFMKHFDVPSYELDYERCDAASEEFRQYVLAYNDRLDRFLAGPTEPRKLRADRPLYKRGFRQVDRYVANHLRRYEGIGAGPAYSANVAFEEKVCTGKTALYNILALREAVVAIGRIYPDMDEVAPALETIDTAIDQIGSEDDIRAHIEGNLAEALEAVRMKPARLSNASWEATMRQRFTSQFSDRTFIKQHLMGDWNIKRHWLTGRPLYRRLGSWIANSAPDGKCYVTSYGWRQTFNGASYSGDRFERTSEVQILCKNI